VWAGFTSLTQPDWAAAPLLYRVVASIAYAVACPAGGLFLLAVCLRFARMRRAALDSLSANAYGMYLVHYVFIVWLQYLLLPAGLPAIAKAAIVFAGTLALSWASCVAYARLARGSYPFTAGRAVSPLLR
jgi:peptidoglycan/LPS O-acetylase OafA/YrhL